MKENRSFSFGPAVLASVLFCFSSLSLCNARANPFDNFGLGSRSAAMAGAMTAVADDFSASLYNPAGLTDAGHTEISLGYFHATPWMETYWGEQWWNADEDTVSGIVLGLVFPAVKFLGLEFVGGLGLHLPDKRVARSLMLPYDQPQFVMYGARNQRTVILSPNALRIFSWLSIGAGFQMFLDTSGGPAFELIQERPDNAGKYSEGRISSSQKPKFFPFAGIMVEPGKEFKLGFCFRDKQEITLDVPLQIRIEALQIGFPELHLELPASLLDMSTPAVLFFSPRQYAFGISWEPLDHLLLAADLTFMQWSEFINPSPDGYSIYYGGLAILLRQNPNFHMPQGNLKDTWVPAAGVEYRALNTDHVELDLRMGYRFRETPVPEQTGRSCFMDSNTHIITGGVGLTFKNLIHKIMREPFSVDFHVQYFHMDERTYTRDLLVAVSDRFGDIRFRGQVLNLGVTGTFRF
jgi:long-chain fatty acid transport protein